MFPYLEYFRLNFHEFYPIFKHDLLEACINTQQKELPHLLIYGPSGNVKNELCYHLIQWLVQHFDVSYIKHEVQTHTLSNGVKIDLSVKFNDCFVEYTPSEHSVYDKYILSDVIKPAITQRNISFDRHIILINNAHELSKNAMLCLRKMMENYTRNALFILKANSISHIDKAIVSRCTLIRLPAPTVEQLTTVLDNVATCFDLDETALPGRVRQAIVHKADRNVHRMLIYLTTYEITRDVETIQPIIYQQIGAFVTTLSKTKLPWTVIPKIREFVYKLLLFNIPHAQVFKEVIHVLAHKYKKRQDLLCHMVSLFAKTETELREATKPCLMYEYAFYELFQAIHG
jgi:replication factor C subunit 3/5